MIKFPFGHITCLKKLLKCCEYYGQNKTSQTVECTMSLKNRYKVFNVPLYWKPIYYSYGYSLGFFVFFDFVTTHNMQSTLGGSSKTGSSTTCCCSAYGVLWMVFLRVARHCLKAFIAFDNSFDGLILFFLFF